jgi:hypothetical protein
LTNKAVTTAITMLPTFSADETQDDEKAWEKYIQEMYSFGSYVHWVNLFND